MCEAAGRFVDPGLMPCIANYRECSYYIARARVHSGISPALTPAPGAQPLARTEIVARLEEQTPPQLIGERGAEELEEEVSRMLRDVEGLAIELNEKWSAYEEGARRLLKMWEETSSSGAHVLRALNDVINMYERLLNNLGLLLDSGRLSQKAYEELKSEAESNLNNFKRRREELERVMKSVERLITPHIQRVKVSEAKPEIGKLRISLMKLEQMFKEGKVSEEVYEKMKKELEERIKRLEQIAGGGA